MPGMFKYLRRKKLLDLIPDPVSFSSVSNATLSSVVDSNTVTVTGVTGPATFSCTNCQLVINGSTVASSGVLTLGQTIKVRVTASSSSNTTTVGQVNISGTTYSFSVTTMNASILDYVVGGTVSGNTFTSTTAGIAYAARSTPMPQDGNWWYVEAVRVSGTTTYCLLGFSMGLPPTNFGGDSMARTRGVAARWYNGRYYMVRIENSGAIVSQGNLGANGIYATLRTTTTSGNVITMLPYGSQHQFSPNIAAAFPGNAQFNAPCYPLLT